MTHKADRPFARLDIASQSFLHSLLKVVVARIECRWDSLAERSSILLHCPHSSRIIAVHLQP